MRRLRYGTTLLAYRVRFCAERCHIGFFPNVKTDNCETDFQEGLASVDAIDRRLLAELQDEGRVTNVELAQRVGLTAPPCLRRVRALEDAGVIKGYHAELDASKLGFAITVFALVSLKSQAEESLRQFEEHMRTLAEVRECHMLNGEIDFILKIVSRDLQSFQEFLTSKLTPAPNVASVKTSLTIRTAKQIPGVPLED